MNQIGNRLEVKVPLEKIIDFVRLHFLKGIETMRPVRCGNCQEEIPEETHPYTIRIEFFPRLEDSLHISKSDLEVDFDEELKRVIEKLEAMSTKEAQLEEERVYSSFTFTLCLKCRDLLALQLKRNVSTS